MISQRAQRSKKFDRSKFLISIEIFDLDRKFQSRRLDFPTKNRAAVGGSLENFIPARNFQSRSKSRIFLIFGPSGISETSRRLSLSEFLAGRVFRQISSLLEKSSPIFRRHERLSLPRFGHCPARNTAAGKSAPPSGTLLDFLV